MSGNSDVIEIGGQCYWQGLPAWTRFARHPSLVTPDQSIAGVTGARLQGRVFEHTRTTSGRNHPLQIGNSCVIYDAL
jgi:hypothetical protein